MEMGQPIKVSMTGKLPSMNAQGGMFTGSAFDKQGPVKAQPASPRRAQAIPSKPGNIQRSMGERFIPAGSRQGSEMGNGMPRPVRLMQPGMGQEAPAVEPYTPVPIIPQPELPTQGGKTRISLDEAKVLFQALEVALAPITENENIIEQHACLREMQAGAFPIVRRLGDRLRIFVGTAAPTDTFELSHGELTMAQKTLDCAESIGREQNEKVILTTLGIGGAAALLLFLL